MSTEKTPVLYLNKTSFDEEDPKREYRARSTLGWIFVCVLFLLLVFLIVQFFYSPFDQGIRFWAEHPTVDVLTIRTSFKESFLPTQQYEAIPLKPWDLDFLIDPAHLCATPNSPDSPQYANDPEVKLLILVPSAVDHFEQRRAIRNTWGSVAGKPMGPVRLAFALGTTSNPDVDRLVREESLQFGDIILLNLPDARTQMTAKSILMLKWMAQNCAHAQYFLKADDDTFVNLGNVARILGYEPYLSQDKFISGYVQTSGQPQRVPDEEFYISEEDYPGEEYPPYASGSAYVMTVPTAIELFDASRQVSPLLPEEDVFLTGLCAQHIAAPLIHEPSFVINDPPIPPSWEAYSSLAAAHSVTPDNLELIWSDMTRSVRDSLSTIEAALNSTVLLRMKENV